MHLHSKLVILGIRAACLGTAQHEGCVIPPREAVPFAGRDAATHMSTL